MKLIYCTQCQDVFKLARELRQCSCGRCKGKYKEDGHHAVNNGKGISLAISNPHLWNAVGNLLMTKGAMHSSDGEVKCWVRPNEGPFNPRSKVDKDL
jgi:hypothetical protein